MFANIINKYINGNQTNEIPQVAPWRNEAEKKEYNEILQTGFVGCAHCYYEIDQLKETIKKMYGGKTHKGKKVSSNGNF